MPSGNVLQFERDKTTDMQHFPSYNYVPLMVAAALEIYIYIYNFNYAV